METDRKDIWNRGISRQTHVCMGFNMWQKWHFSSTGNKWISQLRGGSWTGGSPFGKQKCSSYAGEAHVTSNWGWPLGHQPARIWGPQYNSTWGNGFCHNHVNSEADFCPSEPSYETSALKAQSLQPCKKPWRRGPNQIMPEFLTHRNYYIINVRCFMPLNFVLICHSAIED